MRGSAAAGVPRGVLVIGYGNTLRRDDGVGAAAAARMADDPRFAGVEVRAAYQLLPEMALDMGEAALVVLVDADMNGLPGSIEVRAIDAAAPAADADSRGQAGASSHHVYGGELLALAAELTGRRPLAYQVGIGIADIDTGEGLSPAVEAAIPRVADAVLRVIEGRPPAT